MKLNRRLFAVLSCLALLSALSARAQNVTHFKSQFGSKVRIDGSGNVHDWTVEGQIIGGDLDIDSAFINAPQDAKAGSKVTAKVDASIPVRSIKSGKKAMDDVMHDAMHQQQFPKIEYHLKELTLKETPKSSEGPFQFDSVGDLTISGVTNSIKMPVTMERVDKTKLKTTGKTQLKMTSYGIKPPAPKLALGLIHTDDDVKITFEWLTAPAEK